MASPPFLKRSPKPGLEDLLASAGMSRAGTIRRLRPFLLGRPDVEEDIHYYGSGVGWGLRFRQKDRELCGLVLWPDELFAVMGLRAETVDQALASDEVSEATKEALRTAPLTKGERMLRLRLEDRNQVADFRALVLFKGGGPPPRRRP